MIRKKKVEWTKHTADLLIENFPEHLDGGAIKMSLNAVEVQYVHGPFLNVRVERQLRPLDVERFNCALTQTMSACYDRRKFNNTYTRINTSFFHRVHTRRQTELVNNTYCARKFQRDFRPTASPWTATRDLAQKQPRHDPCTRTNITFF